MKKFVAYICISLLLIVQPAKAQEEFIEPPSKDLTTINFIQLTGGVVIVQARLGNFPDTLNFVMDTGSSGISLDSLTADYFKLQPTPSDRTIRGIAGVRKVSFLYNQSLHFPGLTIDSLNLHINDYSILTAVYGERIDGIIGYSVFSRYIVKIDYDSMQLTFATRGSIRYPKGGFLLKPTMVNQLMAQQVKVKDDHSFNARFMYDMGAGACMLLTKDFIGDSALFDRKKKRFVKEAEGLGGKIDMELTTMKEIKIGPYRFRNVPVYVFNDENNVTSYPFMGGLIGNDILRRFNVILNYPANDIYLDPNSHYQEPFDYSYAGIELYYIDGLIIIGDVAKGSPAEAAGIKEGDEVLAVNKNFSQNLNQYKVALQVPNQMVKLFLRRNGVLLEVDFKVRSILR